MRARVRVMARARVRVRVRVRFRVKVRVRVHRVVRGHKEGAWLLAPYGVVAIVEGEFTCG